MQLIAFRPLQWPLLLLSCGHRFTRLWPTIIFSRDPPPPYRSPPPPSQVLRKSPNPSRGSGRPSQVSPVNLPEDKNECRSPEAVSYNNQYRELVSLVNFQREKLSSQQADLIKVILIFGIVHIFGCKLYTNPTDKSERPII